MQANTDSSKPTNRIREELLSALRALRQEELGPIEDGTRPIDAWGIASAEGIDLSLDLECRLGCSIPNEQNPLVDDQRRCPRTVGEIVDWIEEYVELNEVDDHHG